MTDPTRRGILAITFFEGNPHDSKTIKPLLEQIASDQRPLPREVIYDRGGRGIKEALGVKVTTPTKPKAIEPLIGHLKTDHRLGQNYLNGEESPQINAYLAAAGWNLKKWMEQWVRDGKKLLHSARSYLTGPYHKHVILSS